MRVNLHVPVVLKKACRVSVTDIGVIVGCFGRKIDGLVYLVA